MCAPFKIAAFSIFSIAIFVMISPCLAQEEIQYEDGKYYGTGMGYNGEIKAEVIITNGAIAEINLVEHLENRFQALVEIPQSILSAQSTNNIDVVSAATVTSKGIIQAVENALFKARGIEVLESEIVNPSGKKISLGTNPILPVPVWVIGSYDLQGKPNMMTAAWVGIACSKPPCVTISLRKATYTYGNIMARSAYTVNVLPDSMASEVRYFGSVSGRDVDKLEATGLTPVKSEHVDAPYLDEAPLIVECEVLHVFEIGLHTMFIAEIKDIKADASILKDDEHLDIESLKPLFYSANTRKFYRADTQVPESKE